MPDRHLAPAAAPLKAVHLPAATQLSLNNGIPAYFQQAGTEEIIELKLVLPAGKGFEPVPGLSMIVNKMLQEGTTQYSSLAFAQQLDEAGALLHLQNGYETSEIGMTFTTRHLEKAVALAGDLLLNAAFRENEFEILQRRSLEHLQIEMEKTGYIARREFNRLVFGEGHPYGPPASPEDIQGLQLDAARSYFQSHYAPVNCIVVAVGRFDESRLLKALNDALGDPSLIDSDKRVRFEESKSQLSGPETQPGVYFFEKPESMQATIRAGHPGFPRSHPDYYPMQVVNTIFGGYFGSRLMRNIREDKGFTYGIGSAWLGMKFHGVFLIQTDVGNQYVEPTLKEIHSELHKLIEEGVSAEELDLVRNYMMGRTIFSWETPSQLADIQVSLINHNLEIAEINAQFDIIKAMTTDDVLRLAKENLHPDKLIQVVCGAKTS